MSLAPVSRFVLVALPLAALSLSALGTGCNYSKRNVQACEDWIADMDELVAGGACEATDFDALIGGGCEQFEDSTCDVSGYFDCLYENTECNEEAGEINAEGWNDCVSLSECE